MELRIAGIEPESITDGVGIRYTIFTQGCPHGCPGCHNPESHSFSGGRIVETEALLHEILQNPLLQGVTFSGGEPFCQPIPLAELARQVHQAHLDVAVFTGFSIEALMSMEEEGVQRLLNETDILIDGRYEQALRNLELRYRGSENQRVIDMRKTRENGKVTIDSSWQ